MKSYYLHFIRHGETTANAEGRYIGRTDVPLTRESATALRNEALRGTYPSADLLYVSPLQRCLQTARVIYPGVPIKLVDAFMEYDFGIFENKTAKEVADDPAFLAWTSGKASSVPGGEDSGAFTERVCAGLRDVVYDLSQNAVSHAAVILHGGVIMRLFSVSALPRRSMLAWRCAPGHGFTVRIEPSLYARSGVIEVVGEI